MRKGLWLLLVVAIAVVVTAKLHAAGGVFDPSDPPGGGAGSGPPPSQPGTIAANGSAYYGPIHCFGSTGVVFFITTADDDSLASATVELSDDNLKYYAVSGAVGSMGTVTSVNLANKIINGRVARVTYFPTVDGSAAKPSSSVITDRFIKLKLTANNAQVTGVKVRPVVLQQSWTQEDIENVIYTWTLPG